MAKKTDHERKVESAFLLNYQQYGRIRNHSETQRYINISLKKSPGPGYYNAIKEEESISVLRWVVIYVYMMLVIVRNDRGASKEEKATAEEIAHEITSYLELKIHAITSDISVHLLNYVAKLTNEIFHPNQELYADEIIYMSAEWVERISEYEDVVDLFDIYEEIIYFQRIIIADGFHKNLSDFA